MLFKLLSGLSPSFCGRWNLIWVMAVDQFYKSVKYLKHPVKHNAGFLQKAENKRCKSTFVTVQADQTSLGQTVQSMV